MTRFGLSAFGGSGGGLILALMTLFVVEHASVFAVVIQNRQKLMLAGDPNGAPPDSPANRVDQNTPASPFGGVISLQIVSGGTFICTGTVISPFHILTAGHCVDIDDNGTIDVIPQTDEQQHEKLD